MSKQESNSSQNASNNDFSISPAPLTANEDDEESDQERSSISVATDKPTIQVVQLNDHEGKINRKSSPDKAT